MKQIFGSIKTGKLNANKENKDGKYLFFTCGEVPKKIDQYSFDGKSLIIPGNGMLGNVFIYDGKFDAYQRTYVLMDINKYIFNFKYLYFYFKTYINKHIDNIKNDSVIPYITLPMLLDFEFVIPHIDIQNKIVQILDKLELYAKDINEGLPQEIELRKNQFDFYLNKLLKFNK
ncbi:Type I restriction enzyme specificity protein MPN_089 [Chlamydia abortus]|nr:Type I restriction enzyme specificity protein MPN_089 [Chlamydia abortus]